MQFCFLMGFELTELSSINKGEAITSAEKGHVILTTNENAAILVSFWAECKVVYLFPKITGKSRLRREKLCKNYKKKIVYCLLGQLIHGLTELERPFWEQQFNLLAFLGKDPEI